MAQPPELVVPEVELVVFADFTNLVANGGEGLPWQSRRLALDDLKIVRAEGHVLHVAGLFGDEEDVRSRSTYERASGRGSRGSRPSRERPL